MRWPIPHCAASARWQRLRYDLRWAAIREKHRQRHLSKKKP
jgi:hypothetical protein